MNSKNNISISVVLLVVFFLVMSLSVSTFAFWNSDDEENIDPDEPIKISMLYADNPEYPLKEDWLVIEEVEKIKNVEFDFQLVPTSDFETRRQIVLNSGESPMIITKTWANQVSEHATNNVLLPVSDYLDLMPHFEQKIEEWNLEERIDNLREKNGKFYVFPGFKEILTQTQCYGIRTDILKEHNLETPKTMSELYEVLKTIKENDSSSLGFTSRWNQGMLASHFARAFETNGGWSLPFGYTYNRDKDEWYFAPTSDEYKNFLEYLHSMYEDGILDSEAFTQETEQLNQKILNGKAVASLFWYGEVISLNRDGKEIHGEDFELEVILPPVGPTGKAGLKSTSRYSGMDWIMPASIKDHPRFEEIIAFVDWYLYSDEAIQLKTWGLENETYEVVDNEPQFIEPLSDLQAKEGVRTDVLSIMSPEKVALGTNSDEAEYLKTIADRDMIPVDDPNLKMTNIEKEEEKFLTQRLNDYTNQMFSKFVYGDASLETDWDDYVEQCRDKGSQDLIKMVNEIWDRQNQ
jgi:putative aldouronate transport system substrate-binding protein